MNGKRAGRLARQIIQRLDEGRGPASLRPFGDGPLEAEITQSLITDASIGKKRLAAALEQAIDWCLAESIRPGASQKPLEQLVSLAQISSFARVSLGSDNLEPLLRMILRVGDKLPGSGRAIGMLLRSAGRSNTPLNNDIVSRLVKSSDRELRDAAIEFLARRGDVRALPGLNQSLQTNTASDQLLWTLAHDEDATAMITKEPDDAVSDTIISHIGEALARTDPSGAAHNRWLIRVSAARAAQHRTWDSINYQRVGSQPRRLQTEYQT